MKGICRTVINAVHQSKCDNMEVRDTMRIAAMVFMLIILVGLFINAERQIYKWLAMIFQGLNRPVSGMVFGLLVLTIPGGVCCQPDTRHGGLWDLVPD